MSNMSSYQRNYWYPKVAENQHGEYCKGCGIHKDSNWKNHPFTGLRIDKINNDGNHNICDNDVSDFQLLCISCNLIKNPQKPKHDEQSLQMTHSERKNLAAEKPLMNWLYMRLMNKEKTTYKFFVAEGSYKFDISPKTIKERYYLKYFTAASAPFEEYIDPDDKITYQSLIRFKESWQLKLKDFPPDITMDKMLK